MRREEVIGRTSTELKVGPAQQNAPADRCAAAQRQVDDLPMVANGRDVAIPGRMFAPGADQWRRMPGVRLPRHVRRNSAPIPSCSRSTRPWPRLAHGAAGRLGGCARPGLVVLVDVCYDIHGLPPSAPPRRYIETCVAPPWQDAMRANFRQCIAEQTEWSMEIQIIRADGSLLWGAPAASRWWKNGRVVRIQG